MARARIVKPDFFVDDELAACGQNAMILFAGLWCHSDREGRLEDRPARLKIQILPYFDTDIDAELEKLERAGFIQRYTVDGNNYIQVINFSKHQRPHVNEQDSVIPAPTKVVPEHNQGSAEESPNCPLTLNPSTLNPSCDASASHEYPQEFEDTWAIYPPREGDNPKKKAYQCWHARLKGGRTAEEIRQGVERYREYCQAKGQLGTEFVMQAKRFFGPDEPFLKSWTVQLGKPPRNGRKTFADYHNGGTNGRSRAIDSTAEPVD